jgi:hypothetical protein
VLEQLAYLGPNNACNENAMFPSKSRDPFTHLRSTLSQKNGIFGYTAAKTSKLETFYFLISAQGNAVLQLNV